MENSEDNLTQEISLHYGVDIITFDSDPDSDIDEIRREWQVKAADNLYSYVLNSDYGDEYYSDDEYSRDPGVDYTDDTICYHPGISNRSVCASGASHPGISPQPWKFQPTCSSGKSLVKQN
jgi:hypothetical protein